MKKFLSITLAVIMMASMLFGCTTKEQVAIGSKDDLNGKKLGVQAGTTGETWISDTENVTPKKILSYKSGMDAALQLKNGKIDAVVLDELPAKAIVEKNPELMILDIKLTTEEYAIAVKKGNQELVDSINATIKRMKSDGSFEALNNAYMPADGKIVIPETIVSDASDVIKMGTNAAFPPFEYIDGKNVVGFDITMSENIAKDFGKKLEVVDMQFDSLLNALSSGSIDFAAAGMSVTDERKKSVDFSDPYYSSSQVIIVRK